MKPTNRRSNLSFILHIEHKRTTLNNALHPRYIALQLRAAKADPTGFVQSLSERVTLDEVQRVSKNT
ncbi:hypothetical protein C5468_23180 [Photorhabdus luminescens subsp. mexicana]|uniref:Uncharacterized protein n=1 Tax=Photorhabdus luminescens subsp. mexicana TaxID=2100167 RepID=A0A4R4IV07_PHOLU|nr:hypothetical protein C5468_23180 [Photorhabdus luminescens subsp. mexicana]